MNNKAAAVHTTPSHSFTLAPIYLALVSSSVFAASSQPDSSHVEDAETVVVVGQKMDATRYSVPDSTIATRQNVSVMDIPKSVTTVSSQVLSDQNSDSLIDALLNVSGVTEANSIGGKEDSVIRRGFGSPRDGSLLTDGLKTALPHSFNATTESVEILKGPSSTLYGVLDPSGMVNVVTKKPQQQFGAKVWNKFKAMGAGQYGQSYGLDITDAMGDSHFSYRLISEYEDSDYWRNFGTHRNWTVAPSLMWTSEQAEWLFSYVHQQYLAPYDRGTIYDTDNQSFVGINSRTRLDEALSAVEGHSDLAKVSWTQHFSENWALQSLYGYSQDDFMADQIRTIGYDSDTGAVTRRADTRNYYKRKVHSARSDLTGTLNTWSKQSDVLVGVAYDRETTRRASLQRCNTNSDFNLNDIIYGQMDGCDFDASQDEPEYETIDTASIYAQEQLHINQQWIAVAGLRYQYYNVDAGSGDTQNTDAYGGAVLPNAGVVYKFNPSVSFYTNVGKTFRPNSNIGNPYGNLDPEEGISYEIGTKFQIADRLNATLAAYHSKKENIAYSEVIDGEKVYKTAGLVRSQGIEFDMTAELTDSLQAITSYAYTDAKVLEDPSNAGNQLPNVAKHTASVFLSYDQGSLFLDSDNLRYGGGVHGASKRAGDTGNSFYLPHYAVADLFVAYTFHADNPIKVQLNLNNIFDKTYYTHASSTYDVSVGEAFNATLSASMAFGAM